MSLHTYLNNLQGSSFSSAPMSCPLEPCVKTQGKGVPYRLHPFVQVQYRSVTSRTKYTTWVFPTFCSFRNIFKVIPPWATTQQNNCIVTCTNKLLDSNSTLHYPSSNPIIESPCSYHNDIGVYLPAHHFPFIYRYKNKYIPFTIKTIIKIHYCKTCFLS